MMDRKNKFWTFLKTKGFYLALALAIAGPGTAAWLTAQNAAHGIRESIEEPRPQPPAVEQKANEWQYDDILKQQTETDADARPGKPEPKPEPAPAPKPAPRPAAPVTPAVPASVPAVGKDPVFCLPVKNTEVLAPMSGKVPVKNHTLGVWRTHDGIDLAAAKGAAVAAPAAGTVQEVRTDPLWGGVVTLRHTGGWCSVCRGILPEKGLKTGDRVTAGQILGSVTEIPAESALPPHLHFVLTKDGVPQDPAPLLPLGLQDKK